MCCFLDRPVTQPDNHLPNEGNVGPLLSRGQDWDGGTYVHCRAKPIPSQPEFASVASLKIIPAERFPNR